ncbi:MAG: tRNA pseudouridine(13) synthase TruD [Epsilonproteobacteria bacterium]|nr:tRNA pseudouridine(13) synthase TruD [Campylobacterota bacterium]NPA64554.1 tRNA pseudouridine(13) synthase TruD [Campylobacterota bacterium]
MRRYFDDERATFGFHQGPKSFFVEEIPATRWSHKGGYLILKLQKRGLSTWQVVDLLARHLDQRVTYAGLKDKNATTIQYLSIPKSGYKALKRFYHPNIQILETFLHNRPLKIGDLAGNRFVITLKHPSANLFALATREAQRGVPNYFGYQRFGPKSLDQARKILDGELFIKDRRLENFLLKSYQSSLFNRWLAHRVLLDSGGFKRLEGDVYQSPRGYFSSPQILKDHIPTGLLPGSRVFLARGRAREIERLYDEALPLAGARREALFFPKDLDVSLGGGKARMEFVLPKGSYATIFLESLIKRELTHKGIK